MLNKFLSVVKPGIIFGNAVTLCGGFFLASHGEISWSLFVATLVGVSLIIACGCVINNYVDRDIDALMQRTQQRVLVLGLIPPVTVFIYALFLGVSGTWVLWHFTNQLASLLTLGGLFFYVVVYTLIFKRKSIFATLIGSISGAIPPLVGYCAVSNQIDAGAIILFIMLCLWQVPHSYAIAIFRFDDYLAASIPILPVKKSIITAKYHMVVFVLAFGMVSLFLYFFGYTGRIYLFIASVTAISWLVLSLVGFFSTSSKIWARRMFIFSILIVTVLSITMALDFVA